MMKTLTALGLLVWFAGTTVEKDVPEPYRKKQNPLKATPTLLSETRNLLYEQHCVYCHGESGKGDSEKMVVRKGRSRPDFSKASFGQRSDQWVFWRITEGVAESRMLPYKDFVSEKDRWALVLFVKSFAPKPAPSKSKK